MHIVMWWLAAFLIYRIYPTFTSCIGWFSLPPLLSISKSPNSRNTGKCLLEICNPRPLPHYQDSDLVSGWYVKSAYYLSTQLSYYWCWTWWMTNPCLLFQDVYWRWDSSGLSMRKGVHISDRIVAWGSRHGIIHCCLEAWPHEERICASQISLCFHQVFLGIKTPTTLQKEHLVPKTRNRYKKYYYSSKTRWVVRLKGGKIHKDWT